MSTTPDTDYKAIFSHPEMVIDIITGFAPGPWLDDIDFSRLEPCKSSLIASPDKLAQWCVGLLQAPGLEALFGADQDKT